MDAKSSPGIVPEPATDAPRPIDYSKLGSDTSTKEFAKLIYLLPLGAVVYIAYQQLGSNLSIWAQSSPLANLAVVMLPILVFFGIGAFLIYILVLQQRQRATIAGFALANNWQPAPSANFEAYIPTALAGLGRYRYNNAYLAQLGVHRVVVYSYDYTIGSGKDSRTYYFTIASWLAKNTYPELFLDSRGNGQQTAAYNSDQRIQLEGDFDRYFSLYAIKGGQVDALSIVTPDIMQLVIDSGKDFDVETSGQRISLIGKGNYYSRQRLPQLLNLTAQLAAKFDRLDVVYNASLQASGVASSSGGLRRSQWGKLISVPILGVTAFLVMTQHNYILIFAGAFVTYAAVIAVSWYLDLRKK